MPKLRKTDDEKLDKMLQFSCIPDEKMRMTLIALADKYDEAARKFIDRCYSDMRLAGIYQSIRDSGIYQEGSRVGARHRKIVEFPNPTVFDFVDTVLKGIYGPDWLSNTHALEHPLVRPWWTVNKL